MMKREDSLASLVRCEDRGGPESGKDLVYRETRMVGYIRFLRFGTRRDWETPMRLLRVKSIA